MSTVRIFVVQAPSSRHVPGHLNPKTLGLCPNLTAKPARTSSIRPANPPIRTCSSGPHLWGGAARTGVLQRLELLHATILVPDDKQFGDPDE